MFFACAYGFYDELYGKPRADNWAALAWTFSFSTRLYGLMAPDSMKLDVWFKLGYPVVYGIQPVTTQHTRIS